MATEILERGKTPDGRGIRLQKRGKGYDVIVVDPAGINWVYVEKQVSLEKAKNRFDLETMQHKTNPTKRKFSPAQIAAQKLFAERARAGTLGKGKRKPNPGLYENINAKRARIAAGSGERMRKPGQAGRPTAEAFEQSAMTAKRNPEKVMQQYTVFHRGTSNIAGTVRETSAKAAKEKIANRLGIPTLTYLVARKTNPDKSKPRAYVKRASQATGAPPSKRLVTRRKMALKAPAGYFPNPKAAMMTGYQVICMHPKKHVVGIFKTMAEAKLVARAMADAKGVAYGVKTVKVHKAHFAV